MPLRSMYLCSPVDFSSPGQPSRDSGVCCARPSSDARSDESTGHSYEFGMRPRLPSVERMPCRVLRQTNPRRSCEAGNSRRAERPSHAWLRSLTIRSERRFNFKLLESCKTQIKNTPNNFPPSLDFVNFEAPRLGPSALLAGSLSGNAPVPAHTTCSSPSSWYTTL